jgi:hypothetical protein
MATTSAPKITRGAIAVATYWKREAIVVTRRGGSRETDQAYVGAPRTTAFGKIVETDHEETVAA